MSKTAFKSKLSEFKSELASTSIAIPIQKVVIESKENQVKKQYTQISAYIEIDTLDAIKMKCLKEKKKLSPLIEELLTKWLNG